MSPPCLKPESDFALFRALSLPHSHERARAVADWHETYGSKLEAEKIRHVLARFDGMQAISRHG